MMNFLVFQFALFCAVLSKVHKYTSIIYTALLAVCSNRSSHLGTHKQTNACWSIPRSKTIFIHFKNLNKGCRKFRVVVGGMDSEKRHSVFAILENIKGVIIYVLCINCTGWRQSGTRLDSLAWYYGLVYSTVLLQCSVHRSVCSVQFEVFSI